MNLAATAPGWLFGLLVALLILAAAEDAWRLRIANLTCLAILAGAVIAAILAGWNPAYWQNGALFAGFLALGLPLFAAGRLGGGDVKLIAVSGAWFDLAGGFQMLVSTLLAGGVLAVVVLVLRSFSATENPGRRSVVLRKGSGIPYGVAIAAGSILAAGVGRL